MSLWRSGCGRFGIGSAALAVLGAIPVGCAPSQDNASRSAGGGLSSNAASNASSIVAAVPGDACGQLRDAFGRLHVFFNDPVPPAERYRDPASGPQAMQADLAREAREIEQATQSFIRLRECRWGQAQGFRRQLRGRPMMRMAARQQMMLQRDRFLEELAVADRYRGAMQNRDQAFQSIAQRLTPPQPMAPSSNVAIPAATANSRVAPPPTRPMEVAARETVPEKRNSFAAAITSARAQTQTVFNLDDMPAS